MRSSGGAKKLSIVVILLLLALAGHVVGRKPKHTVKSIRSGDGDIIDCVDMYRQPSLNHPSLRNHTIRMAPTKPLMSSPLGEKKNKQVQVETLKNQVWHWSGSCPEGTVPILRSRSPVMRKNMQLEEWKRIDFGSPYVNAALGTMDLLLSIAGAAGTSSIWPLSLQRDQYSKNYVLAVEIPEGGPKVDVQHMNIVNSVAAGWMVDPNTYSDSCTRAFVEYTTDYATRGCYNMMCEGFVQTSSRTALGAAMSNLSKYGDSNAVVSMKFSLERDNGSPEWWVTIDDDVVGYWPAEIFSLPFAHATDVFWGGEVYDASSQAGRLTPMGSGHHPSEGYGNAAFFQGIKVRQDGEDIDPSELEYFRIHPNCYDVQDIGMTPDGFEFYYGGTGTPSCDS